MNEQIPVHVLKHLFPASPAIFHALGARKNDVLSQFLLVPFTLASVGDVFGIGVHFLFAFVLQTFIKFSAAVPLWAIVVGFMTSAAVELVAGMWPAVREAKMDPVAAIWGN